MSEHLGQCGLSLHGTDLNRLLANLHGVGPISFQHGCFEVYLKLPMGLGVTLVAIPSSSPKTVTFSIPFDQIRGDRTGGMARLLAGGLWGMIRPQIEKMIQRFLRDYGLPPETLVVEQERAEHGGKVGKLVLRLQSVNAWLLRQPPVQGFHGTVDCMWVTETAVNIVLDVYRVARN